MADSPFESLESAQQYVRMLCAELVEVRAEISEDIVEANRDDAPRRVDALHLVDYKLRQLDHHLGTSSRILNDLKMLRRLLTADPRERGSDLVSCTNVPSG